MDRARNEVVEAGPSDQAVPSDVTFEAFFASEHVTLFRALYLMTGSVQEAEELMQEAFLRAWERWDRVREMENPGGYVFRIATNEAMSRFRRFRYAAAHVLASSPPEDPFAAADLRDELVRALASLTERQRMVVVLTDLMDLPADDAAKLLRIKPSSVRSLASQARAALRITMEADHG